MTGVETTAMAELLQWHATADQMPDAEMTVLMWVKQGSAVEWFAGWWDGEAWLDASSGGMVHGEVTHWAEPEGPPNVPVKPA